MKNGIQIQNALNLYLESTGKTCTNLAMDIGVAQTTVMRWANGKAKNIRPIHWLKLKPLIEQYISIVDKEDKQIWNNSYEYPIKAELIDKLINSTVEINKHKLEKMTEEQKNIIACYLGLNNKNKIHIEKAIKNAVIMEVFENGIKDYEKKMPNGRNVK